MAKLRERKKTYSNRLVSGNFADFQEYKNVAGKYFAIEEAEEIAKKLHSDMFESRRLEEKGNE